MPVSYTHLDVYKRQVVLTLLMIQLQSFQRVIMVVLTAPFGLIGVVLFLLLFDRPFGFVAMPVSYTHLDVYKRQRLLRCWLTKKMALPLAG